MTPIVAFYLNNFSSLNKIVNNLNYNYEYEN